MKNKTRFNNCGLDSRLFPTLKFPTSYFLKKKKKGFPTSCRVSVFKVNIFMYFYRLTLM